MATENSTVPTGSGDAIPVGSVAMDAPDGLSRPDPSLADFGIWLLWLIPLIAISKLLMDAGAALKMFAEAALWQAKAMFYDDDDPEPQDMDEPEQPVVEDAKVVLLDKKAA
jgi:hypothetical protein